MYVTCPHCDNLIESSALPAEEILCGACGSSFRPGGSSTETTVAELRTLGKFQLLNRVGAGAFGVVWRARDRELDRIVALKTLHASMLTAASRVRFYREARAAAQLRHPGIVTVHEVKELEGLPTIVAEFVEGMTLRELLACRRLTFRQSAELVALVADALDYAHAAGLVHRDVKPTNIMIELPQGVGARVLGDGRDSSAGDLASGSTESAGSGRTAASLTPLSSLRVRPLLVDFGLALREHGEATMTSDGQILGTPAYMSPEQAAGHGHKVDRRSDVYSLGVVLYELLTGGIPFRGTNVAIVQQVLHDDPRPPRRINHKIPRDLETICQKAMAKEPNRRYDTAARLADDLRFFLRGDPISARPANRVERALRWVRRNSLVTALGAAIASLLVVVAIGASVMAVREHRAARRERQAKDAQAELRARAEQASHVAQAKAEESRQRLVRQFVSTGLERLEQADLLGSLSWFVDALREDQGDPAREEIHRIRIAAVLGHSPKLLQVWLHEDTVVHSEFSRDGSRVVTASFDGTARVWNADTGEPVTPPLRHDGPVLHATFSPDGAQVLTASDDGTARLWDSATGQPIRLPLQHAGRIHSARFSADGRRVATASYDKTARVWDAGTGQPITPPLEHQDILHHVDFSPDGTRLVTASDDSTARLWDASTGEPLAQPLKHLSQLHSALFSPDGRFVVTASNDHQAQVWDAATGEPVTRAMLHQSQVLYAAFSPDGRRVVTASQDETARVWDAATGELTAPALRHKGAVQHVSFSPDGRYVLSASADGSVRLWNSRTGDPITPPLKQPAGMLHAAFSDDGRRVVASGYGRTAFVWDLAAAESGAPQFKHGGLVNYASFSPSGRRVATASADGTARIWDADTGDPVTAPLEHPSSVSSVVFSPDGRRVVTACGGQFGAADPGEARIWEVASGQLATPPLRHAAPVRYAEFSFDGRLVLTASADHTARVWDAATGEPASPPLRHQHWVYHATFSPDGRRIATASFDQTARVWDTDTGEPLTAPLPHDAAAVLYHIGFSPDGQYVVTASSSQIGQPGACRVWRAETGEAVTEPIRTGSVYIFRAAFSSDGQRLLTMGGDRGSRIWDAFSGARLSPAMHHAGTVCHGGFSPNGRLVVTASWDWTARVWDAATGLPVTPLLLHRNEVQHAVFSPDSRRVVTASSDGTARIWHVQPDPRPLEDLISLARLLSGASDDLTTAASNSQIREAWQSLRGRYATDFTSTPNQIVAWHQSEADAAERKRDWAAALFHLDCLIARHPESELLRNRRDRAAARLDP